MTNILNNVGGTDIPNSDVAVIVGRFQVHELHDGQKDLINTVCQRHDRVIVFLGLSPLRNTTNNPLDFNTRRIMIKESFPDIEVYYVEDCNSNEVWSKNLDRQLEKWLKPHQTVTLYGSRDSFISSYSGKYPTCELESSVYVSGTEVRKRISNTFHPSKEMRAGMIAATLVRYPVCYTTVDIAVLDRHKGRILMGRKPNEKFLRFIGGFSSTTSPSFEIDAKREVTEEAGKIETDNYIYIGSTLIDDWRFRKETDKIKTMFFIADYIFGRPEGSDDLEAVEWVDVIDLIEGKVNIMPEHKPLVEMLKKYALTNKGEFYEQSYTENG